MQDSTSLFARNSVMGTNLFFCAIVDDRRPFRLSTANIYSDFNTTDGGSAVDRHYTDYFYSLLVQIIDKVVPFFWYQNKLTTRSFRSFTANLSPTDAITQCPWKPSLILNWSKYEKCEVGVGSGARIKSWNEMRILTWIMARTQTRSRFTRYYIFHLNTYC